MTERDEELREWLLSKVRRNEKFLKRVEEIKRKRAERIANMTPEEREAHFGSVEEALKASKAIEESLRGRASKLARGRRRLGQ